METEQQLTPVAALTFPGPEPALDQLAVALVKAQAAMRGAVKDSKNPHFGSTYADLASIWDACRGPLTDNGLCVIQMPGRSSDGLVTVTTLLLHVSGQRIESTVGVKPSKDDAQGLGSVLTYLRRYALAAMVGIAPEDDDGEAAVGRGQTATIVPKRPPAPPKPPESERQPVVPGKGILISDGQRKALEAAIGDLAKAWKMDPKDTRQSVKDKCGTHYGVEHFAELKPDQFDTVMKWLGQETRKAGQPA